MGRTNSVTDAPSSNRTALPQHLIRYGETLSVIAAKYNLSVQDLLTANRHIKNPDRIFAGQSLAIPLTRTGQSTPTQDYTVRRGETLTEISERRGVELEKLIKLNFQIRNPDLIFPGQRIRVPVSNSTSSPAQPSPSTRPTQPTSPTQPAPSNPSSVNPNAIPFNQIVGVRGNSNVTSAFQGRVREIAARLETKPEYILAVMSFETGGTFSPSVRNNRSTATGLIQFLDSTARGLGTTTNQLARMTSVEQLAFVEKYFAPFKGRLDTLEAVYTAVLSGSPRRNPTDILFARGTEAYRLNSGLDFNRNGQITAGEATAAVAARLFGGVRRVQERLRDLGFNPGTIDNAFGQNTSRAIAAFQTSRNIPATGLLDEQTGSALFSNAASNPPRPAPNQPTPPTSPPSTDRAIPHGRPTQGTITSEFNPSRRHPITGAIRAHNGIDIGAPTGTRVNATADGVVRVPAFDSDGYGNWIEIDHGNGYKTRYAHLSEVNVRDGERVTANQKIGEVGSTGDSTGAHLHYEVRRNGQAVNPRQFF